jgi:hypothetical protein
MKMIYNEDMIIDLEDSRSLEILSLRGEVELWLHDALTRSKKKIGLHRGGKYVEFHPELFEIAYSGHGKSIVKAIRDCHAEPQAEFTRRLTCLRRSIVLKVLLLRRSI